MNRVYTYLALTGMVVIIALYFMRAGVNKVPNALDVDATKDTTDMAGTYYRVKVTNIGSNSVSNISVFFGGNDVQRLDILGPDQIWFFYPRSDTNVSKVHVTAANGINILTEYRSPLKGLGLPGSGR